MSKQRREIVKLIDKIGKKYPELRFCQIIQNCYGNNDIYYVENSDLLTTLKDIYEL